MRLGAIFVAVCMALISISIGGVAYLSLGFSVSEATIAGVATLSALALINAVTTRGRDRADVSTQVADLSRGIADLARQVGDLGRRVAALEGATAEAAAKARAASAPLAAEIGELSLLIKEIADVVAVHEQALGSAAPAAAPPASAAKAATTAPAAAAPRPAAQPPQPPQGLDQAAAIRRAVEGDRIELYLQPIVTLPQRKVRYYEGLARLRGDDGELFAPSDFLPIAEADGLMPGLDKSILFRCVQVVRRLQTKSRELGLFCNVSVSTLNDVPVFADIVGFLEANRALASSIVLEFTQSAVRGMGPLEHASLAALAEIGFRFSMDHLQDLHIDPREIAERGFRYVKAPAALLLRRAGHASDIHPADFSDLLGRFGVDLIAEEIETEANVVDLLDYDVRFGQGILFSPPRPVRSEVLQDIANRLQPATARGAGDLPAVRGPEPLSDGGAAERRAAMSKLARTTVRRT